MVIIAHINNNYVVDHNRKQQLPRSVQRNFRRSHMAIWYNSANEFVVGSKLTRPKLSLSSQMLQSMFSLSAIQISHANRVKFQF